MNLLVQRQRQYDPLLHLLLESMARPIGQVIYVKQINLAAWAYEEGVYLYSKLETQREKM